MVSSLAENGAHEPKTAHKSDHFVYSFGPMPRWPKIPARCVETYERHAWMNPDLPQ